ncbi:dTDP-4-dehydrorhamnose 3,5-epimerase [Frankia sp. AiPs1]|uniref:dTDP-4-dehydrorhamnose 3,5-epimerase n=1 Tax=Frankia sp. AiPa1 TaxID=573492 RepID=UPI00202B9A9A|nr:dTDP-4-dehydrorhamnose 3,5-epimerase [Frankia sp. AiPa1]MCL9761232.1 dTDP-4-dehydrorhamnose 3,5-epimerase [Frankia sp. AiPa1]
MEISELSVPDAWVFTPRQHSDSRGTFLEWFRSDVLAEVLGHPLALGQANHSVSRGGTLRGVHYAQVPPSQAKYVTCVRGQVLDCVVDIRIGSPTFGDFAAVLLDDIDRRGLYVAEGLGHAFLALTDDAAITYLCSTPYNPGREHGIHPLDPDLDLPWPAEITPLLSEKDAAAPTLKEAEAAGLLPTYAECQAFYAQLRSIGPDALSGAGVGTGGLR